MHGLGTRPIMAYFYFLDLKKNSFSNRANEVISKRASSNPQNLSSDPEVNTTLLLQLVQGSFESFLGFCKLGFY